MTIREGRWDCTQCATRGILGREMSCIGCGHKRPENTEFYLPPDEPEVTDVALLKRAEIGPDWYCSRCASSNRADDSSCTQCGSGKDSASSAPFSDYERNPAPHEEYRPARFQSSRDEPQPSSTNWPLWGVIALLISLVAFTLWPRSVDLQIVDLSWQRQIQIQRYTTLTEEDWSIPSSGRELARRRAIHHYDHIVDHYESRTRQIAQRVKTGTESYTCGSRSKGNGFFEDVKCSRDIYSTQYRTVRDEEAIYRDDPVYRTKYRFEIDKWVYTRTEQSNGQRKSQEPHWPKIALIGDGTARVGNEREAERSERYTVHFVSRDKNTDRYQHVVDRATWSTFDDRIPYTATVTLGHLSQIRPMQSPIK